MDCRALFRRGKERETMKKTEKREKGKYLNGRKKGLLPVLLGVAAVLAAVVFAVWMLLDPGAPAGDPTGTGSPEQSASAGTTVSGETEETADGEQTEPEAETAVRNEDVADAYIDDQLHLILVLKDGSEVDQGYVGDNTDHQKQCVVTFRDHDGTVLKTETVRFGTAAVPPADPVREGYTFAGWDGSYTNVTSNAELTAQYREDAPAVEMFTVRFEDGSGNVLKTQVVEKGAAADAPADPVREGYEFTGWDKAFDRVEADLTVTAQFVPVPDTDPALQVADVSGAPGERVQVAVTVKNNPGIAGARIVVNFDQRLELTAAEPGEVFSALDYTRPASLTDGCAFNWDSLDAQSTADGTVLLLTFRIPADAGAGEQFRIKTSCRNGDIYDTDLNIVNLAARAGSITVE